MRGMTLEKIAEAVGGRLYTAAGSEGQKAAEEATAVVIDSRKIEPGAVFVATRGERVDGHDFIGQVFENGALGVICERLPALQAEKELPGPCIVVDDSFIALKKLAKYYREQMSEVKIVGIVGSVGKTSTKELVASVLEQKYSTLKTEGNFNNEIGVPLTVLRLRDEHQAAVVEMGINKFGEMNRLGIIVQPDAVVMTNIGPCHLEFLGDLDGVLKAKSEVFAHIRKGGFLALNSADERLKDVIAHRGEHGVREDVRTAGYGENGEVRAENVRSLGLEGTEFTVRYRGAVEGAFRTTVPLPGIHMVQNALAATAIGREFGLTDEEITRGIMAVKPVKGRSNLIRTDRYLIVDDCYNANPKSMMAAIDLMKDALGRKVAILGDMFELGSDEAELHARVGSYAAENGIDVLVCVGALSANMYRAALEAAQAKRAGRDMSESGAEKGTCEIRYFTDREQLLGELDTIGLLKGDTILVKASHGMGFTEVVERLQA